MIVPALAFLAAPLAAQDYAARMAHLHADDRPIANASAIAPRADVDTQQVSYGTGINGYLAKPKSGNPKAAVIMIHEWWGLNDNIRMMARRLAGEGYTVLAVDLYGGRFATTPDSATVLTRSVMQNKDAALANLHDAVAYVRAHGARKVGVMGWCFGGGWSIQTALAEGDAVNADIAYYGSPELDRAKLAQLKAPFLGLYGGANDGIPVAKVHEMETALDSLHKTVAVKVYDGAKHAFANPSGTHYDQAAADDAWQRTTTFFAKYLKA